MSSRLDNQKRPLILRVIYHPMFYVSLLLHGLVFAIPGTPEPEVPPELDPEEEQAVAITMLDPIIEPEPEIELEEPEPEPPPPDEPPPPQTTQQTKPEPVASPDQQAPPPDPEPEPPSDAQNVNPDTQFDPTEFRNAFSGNLSDLPGYVGLPINATSPVWEENTEREFYSIPPGEEPAQDSLLRPGIISTPELLNDIKIENVSPERSGAADADGTLTGKRVYLGASFAEGVTLSRAGDYGGGPVYEVVSPEGETIMYLNVVPSSGGAAVILVQWSVDPNNPDPEGLT